MLALITGQQMLGFGLLWCLGAIGLPYAAMNLPVTAIFLGLKKYQSRRFLCVHSGITLAFAFFFVVAALALGFGRGRWFEMAIGIAIVLAYCLLAVGTPIWQYRVLSLQPTGEQVCSERPTTEST